MDAMGRDAPGQALKIRYGLDAGTGPSTGRSAGLRDNLHNLCQLQPKLPQVGFRRILRSRRPRKLSLLDAQNE